MSCPAKLNTLILSCKDILSEAKMPHLNILIPLFSRRYGGDNMRLMHEMHRHMTAPCNVTNTTMSKKISIR